MEFCAVGLLCALYLVLLIPFQSQYNINMSTVILGGGIIGCSIAYYLTSNSSPHKTEEVHIVESSSQLFSAASGYAAGFLAKDWFASSVAPLGALSFNLHRELAAEHGGAEKWGYMKSTALGLDVGHEHLGARKGARGDDWLRQGTSRREAAARLQDPSMTVKHDESPAWLTRQEGGRVENISHGETAAQVLVQPVPTFLCLGYIFL